MPDKPDILARIVEHKIEEVAARRSSKSDATLWADIDHAPVSRGFASVLCTNISNGRPGIIAEIKKASPSKGIIREEFDPVEIAVSYTAAGASCLSVLTDEQFFQGNDDYLIRARAACDLPVLRKDFIVDPYQVLESRAIGADCILLIVAILDDSQLVEFSDLAMELDMSVLVEVHDEEELRRALELPGPLIGINNRNLRNFQTTLSTTLDLLPLIGKEKVVITESGINTVGDVVSMRQNGVHGFLVGEACMREKNPGDKILELFFAR